MQSKVFYSWQSDLPGAINRSFIQDALERAAKHIRQDDSIAVEPVIDRDTQNVPGAPDIGSTIFKKIDEAAVFVCDVSFINAGATNSDATPCRPTPNPNVLIELGYAAHALGWDRIILVMNDCFGRREELPFDLRPKRVLTYSLGLNEAKANAREHLQNSLQLALRSILNHAERQITGTQAPSLTDQTLEAIKNQSPEAGPLTRHFIEELVENMVACAPEYSKEERLEELTKAIEDSIPISVDFARIAAAASASSSLEAASSLVRGFELIAHRYHVPSGFSGSYNESDFDFYKFIGHELFVTLIGLLVRDERWQILSKVFEEDFRISNAFDRPGQNPSISYLSLPPLLLALASQKNNRPSLHADLLKARHESGPLSKLFHGTPSWTGTTFLFFRFQLHAVHNGIEWFAWSAAYLSQPARFIYRLDRASFVQSILPALGLKDVSILKSRLADPTRVLNPKQIWGNQIWAVIHPFPQISPEIIGNK